MKKFKWIKSFLMKYKGLYLLSLFLLIMSIITNILMTAVQKYLIDDVFIKGKYNNFTVFLIIYFSIVILFLISWVAKDMLFERIDSKLKILLRMHAMGHLARIQTTFYYNERVAKILFQLNEYVNSSNIFTYRLPSVLENLLNLIFLSIIVGIADWSILLSVSILGIAYIFMGRYFFPKLKKSMTILKELKTNIEIDIEEGISSSREVVAFHRETWEKNKMDRGFIKYFKKVKEDNRLRNQQMILTDTMKWGATLIVLGYGGYGVIRGSVSLGMLVIIYQFTFQLIDACRGLYYSILNLRESMAAVERAGLWLVDVRTESEGIKFNESIQSIEFNQVSFKYSDHREDVLSDFNLYLPSGKKIAFVGTSGGGKSTVAQLLIGFYQASKGIILVNGHLPLQNIDMESWRSKIAIVFQDPFFFPASIRENILLGRSFDDSELVEVCKICEIHEAIISLPNGYETILGERGVTLSGGQRQRLALARAIISDPEVLILDESTSALDQETERKLMFSLDLLRKGKTTIIIAHRLSTIENADLILVIHHGKIVEMGRHEELLLKGSPYYKRLVIKNEESNVGHAKKV